ncbi:hypothetical protein B0H13DRAFT_2340320 [Mycena leptocephala]|nr:hypothetical protein B0H13DRAFT_2340320 [Mycena leptocephala]
MGWPLCSPYQTPLGVPLEAHAVVMGLRWKMRRCDVLSSRAGHFAPPNQTPLGVPLEAHAVVMGLRWKTRRCDVLLSRAGHFAPPTKHPWDSLSRPMQSLWGSGGKRVGAMCYHHGRAILLPSTKESLSRPMQSLWGSGGKRVGAMCYHHGLATLLPPTKHHWESLSRPMQSLWGFGGKRVGAMCYYHGRAILLPPPNTPGTPSRGPCSSYGAPAENASVQCATIAGWPLCSPH